MRHSPPHHTATLRVNLAVALLPGGLAYLDHGTQRARRLDNGIGKQARHLEFSLFAQQVDPRRRGKAETGKGN